MDTSVAAVTVSVVHSKRSLNIEAATALLPGQARQYASLARKPRGGYLIDSWRVLGRHPSRGFVK